VRGAAAVALLALGLALPAAAAEQAELLSRADLAGGKLSVAVYSHSIETRDGPLRCWTYVSKGLAKLRQAEIVFTLRRTPDLEYFGFPEEIYDYYETVYRLAKKGQIVGPGGYTIYHPGAVLLGRADDWGILYLPAQPFPGIDIPSGALSALLVRGFEVRLIENGYWYRVATAIAGACRYYPYPPWSDPDRKLLTTKELFEASTLSQYPARTVFGVTAKTAILEPDPEGDNGLVIDEGTAEFGPVIVLRFDPKALRPLRAAAAGIPFGAGELWLVEPDPGAGSRLCWLAEKKEAIGLYPPSGPREWITGGFALIGRFELNEQDNISTCEDGFLVALSEESWRVFIAALATGRPAEIPRGRSGYALRIEFGPSGKAGRSAT
jgi:hypothetical protein